MYAQNYKGISTVSAETSSGATAKALPQAPSTPARGVDTSPT
jgi:hypothetical protein